MKFCFIKVLYKMFQTPEISDPSMGTSFMHFLPDSFQMLSSECLEDDPWQKFPFTGFVAMLSVTSHSAI